MHAEVMLLTECNSFIKTLLLPSMNIIERLWGRVVLQVVNISKEVITSIFTLHKRSREKITHNHNPKPNYKQKICAGLFYLFIVYLTTPSQ
jgi:hypothetical protein